MTFYEHTYSVCAIQSGILGAVRSLNGSVSSSTITLTWKRPFSLNLTTAEPDIVYCMDVYGLNFEPGEVARSRAHLISDCTVFGKAYTFNDDNPDPTTVFHFVVTPRSNVEGTKNGTASSIERRFSYERKLNYYATKARI